MNSAEDTYRAPGRTPCGHNWPFGFDPDCKTCMAERERMNDTVHSAKATFRVAPEAFLAEAARDCDGWSGVNAYHRRVGNQMVESPCADCRETLREKIERLGGRVE